MERKNKEIVHKTGGDLISVSVCMTTYNGEVFLGDQLKSILTQIGVTDEVVVVDDCSVDQTHNILLEFAKNDSRIKLFFNEQNMGVIKSFEKALAQSQGEIIFLADQDDIWVDGKYSTFIDIFERKRRTAIVISDAEIINKEGVVIASSFMEKRGGFSGGVCATLWRNRYLGCAMALRREVLNLAIPIPRFVPMHDMWLGAIGSIVGQVCYIPTKFLRYRRHDFNVSPSRPQSVFRMLRGRFSLFVALVMRLIPELLSSNNKLKN